MAVFSKDKQVFLGHFRSIIFVLQGKVNDPGAEHNTANPAKDGDEDIRVAPAGDNSEIFELPKPKEGEWNKAKPQALIDCSKANSPLEDSLCEFPQSFEFIDSFVFEEGDDQSPRCIEDDNHHVLATADKEGGIVNHVDEGDRGGNWGVALGNQWEQDVG